MQLLVTVVVVWVLGNVLLVAAWAVVCGRAAPRERAFVGALPAPRVDTDLAGTLSPSSRETADA